MKIQHKKELRGQAKLGLVGIVASAVLGATLTYSVLTNRHKRELNEFRHNVVFERVDLYLKEWERCAYKGEEVNRDELARQYGIPLTERKEIDYQALQKVLFPLEYQD